MSTFQLTATADHCISGTTVIQSILCREKTAPFKAFNKWHGMMRCCLAQWLSREGSGCRTGICWRQTLELNFGPPLGLLVRLFLFVIKPVLICDLQPAALHVLVSTPQADNTHQSDAPLNKASKTSCQIEQQDVVIKGQARERQT